MKKDKKEKEYTPPHFDDKYYEGMEMLDRYFRADEERK